VALGDSMQRVLVDRKGADPARTVVIPDWADGAAITPGPKRNAFSTEHGLADRFVVMHSGNIGLSQELEAVVRAAEHLKPYPDIVLVFVGDGVKKPALVGEARRLGLDNVRFLPYAPKERLRESFASADVFIVSLRRGLAGVIVPSKLYGILAAGRPYVAAVEEESEPAAIARRYDCGLVAAPGDDRRIAECILRLYRDPALARGMGDRARTASAVFDRGVQVRAYFDLFTALARPALGAT
jgi:colanic acid biosynthesis glycosyl transferase WcaI